MRSRRATVLFATLVAALGAGVGDAVDARRGEVVEAFVDVNDPVGDVIEPTTDITRAYVELDGGLFVSLRTDQFSGFPGDDFDWWGNNRSVTWHLDTDFDGADDYRVVYTGRPAFPGVVDAAEYDVVNASGEVTCTGSWIIFFGEPWPLDGIHAGVQGECIGNPAALQWFVEYRYQTGAKYEYIDRAPNTGWSGPVTNSNPPPTVPDVPPVPPTGPITPVPPRRVFDSRPAGVLPIGVHRIRIAGRGGVPVDASAVLLNVTVDRPSGAGFATVFPCRPGGPPEASNLNYADGQTVAASAFSGVDSVGDVCVFVSTATHLIVDVNGYIPAGSDVTATEPFRLLDTRSSARAATGSVTEVVVAGRGGVPAEAAAAFLNVTAVGPGGAGYLTVFPCGEPTPDASNVNHAAGRDTPNAVLAKLGDDGKVCVFSYADTHLIVDVNGYIGAGAANAAAITPFRMFDSRTTGARVAAGSVTPVTLVGRGGVPADANAVMLNVTVDQPTEAGFLTLYPCGSAPPDASNVNFVTGQTVSNAVLALPAPDGRVCVFASAATHVIVDATGFVTP